MMERLEQRFQAYFSELSLLSARIEATDRTGTPLGIGAAVEWVHEHTRGAHAADNKIMFVGNGGSAGIASHCAIDYSKNGNLRALAFNDGAALTCLGNDLGYEQVFAKQLDLHARRGDVLFAISSSGNSMNIRNAVAQARQRECHVVTLSGFNPDNPLRSLGDVNFYVSSGQYGFVEILHLSICHAILDLHLGWGIHRAGDPPCRSQ